MGPLKVKDDNPQSISVIPNVPQTPISIAQPTPKTINLAPPSAPQQISIPTPPPQQNQPVSTQAPSPSLWDDVIHYVGKAASLYDPARLYSSAGVGVARSIVGTAQGISGLVDLVSPGTGTSRISKGLDVAAKKLDTINQTSGGNSIIYKGAQAATDIATLVGGGEIAKGIGEIPKVANVTNKISQVASKVPGVTEATAKIADYASQGALQKTLVDVGKSVISPKAVAINTGYTGLGVGQQASKGVKVTPTEVAQNFATNATFGASSVVLAKGLQVLLKNAANHLPNFLGAIKDGTINTIIQTNPEARKLLTTLSEKIDEHKQLIDSGLNNNHPAVQQNMKDILIISNQLDTEIKNHFTLNNKGFIGSDENVPSGDKNVPNETPQQSEAPQVGKTPNIDNEIDRATIDRARMMDQGLPENHPDMISNEKRITDLSNSKNNGIDIKPTDDNSEMKQEYVQREDSNLTHRTQPNEEQELAIKEHKKITAMDRLSGIIMAKSNLDEMIKLRADELKDREIGRKSDIQYEVQARNDFEKKNPEIPKVELDAYDMRKDYENTINNVEVEDNIPVKPSDENPPVKNIISDVRDENRRPDINDPEQQTTYQPKWHVDFEQPLEYRTKLAAAEADGYFNKLKYLLDLIETKAKKLSKNDRELLSDAANGNLIPKAKLNNPELFNEITNDFKKYMDRNLAVKRLSGRDELKRNKGNTAPLFFQADKEQMDKLGIPQHERFELNGKTGWTQEKIEPGVNKWTDRSYQRKYNDYTVAYEKSGGILVKLNKDVIEDLKLDLKNSSIQMQSNLLREALQAHVPEHVSIDMNASKNGKKFSQLGRNNFVVSDDIKPYLKNFKESIFPTKGVGALAIKSVEKVGYIAKAIEWLFSPYHYNNLRIGIQGLNGITGNAPQGDEELLAGMKSITESKEKFLNHLEEYSQSGKLDQMSAMGIVIKYNTVLERYETAMLLKMADAALDNKIHVINPYSKDGIELGKVYNAVAAGRINPVVQGFNRDIQRIISIFGLAPNYLRANLTIFRDAFFPRSIAGKELPKFARGLGRDGGDGPGGKGPLINKFTPGGTARGFVVGKRALQAAMAVTITTIILGRLPTKDELIQEIGFGKDPSPNIQIKDKNQNNEKQQYDLPADPLSLIFNLIKNPDQFFASRTSPIINFANELITNKNYNNKDIQSPGQSFTDRVKYAAENSFIPMAAQGFVNINKNINNPSIVQSFIQQAGLRLKTNPNDPQVIEQQNQSKTMSNIVNKIANSQYPGMEGIDKKTAQYYVNEFNNLHPTNMTDIYGNKIATPFDAYSGDKKYESELDTSGTTPKLNGVFYANKELATLNPNYPTNPLYKLQGTGIDNSGNQNADKALVAIEYRLAEPGAKADLIRANGGANGWLAAYEADLGQYSQNYQANLTNYFQNLGWTQKAIDDYWTKHPSSPDPVDQLNIPIETQKIATTYQQMAQTDPVAAKQYFNDNKTVLNAMYDQVAVHAQAVAKQRGEAQLQGFPKASSEVQKILDSMPQGADSNSKAIRANLIDNNATVRQYLTDVNLWEVTNLGSQFKYIDPAHPNQTIGQNVNSNTKQGQTFLKDVSNLGRYDIGKDASTGVYQVMQNGGFPAGTTISGTGGTRRIKPRIYHAKKTKSLRITRMKLPRSRPVRLAKQRSIKIKG